MNHSYSRRIATILVALTAGACASFAQDARAVTTTTVTGATGSIAQLNYSDSGGTVAGFLVGTTTLLNFPSNVCAGVASLGAAGNSITYSGTAVTYTSGFEAVSVTSFTNNTTGATYTKPTAVKATAYGPVSGTIKQINYGENGVINGFVFTPATGSAVFVELPFGPNSTLSPLLKAGAAVSVTGTSEAPVLCPPTGTLTEVNPSSLTIGTTTVSFGFGGHGGR